MSDCPRSVAAITSEWLSDALHRSGVLPTESTVAISAVEPVGEIVGFVCEIARLRLVVDGDPGQTPTSAVVKLPVDDDFVRTMLADARLYQREGGFFADAAPRLAGLVPRCFLNIHDESEGDYLLLLEDLGAGTPGDQRAGCDADQAERVLHAAAVIHAKFWQSPVLDAMRWLPPVDFPGNLLGAELYPALIEGFTADFGELLDPANAAVTEGFADAIPRLLDRMARLPRTLNHFDLRLDNTIFMGDRPEDVRLIDFQTVCAGGVGYDLGYFLSQSLPIDERRAHERDLVGSYHQRLVAEGVDGFGFDDAWAAYRNGVVYGWGTPVIVTSSLDMSDPRVRGTWTEVITRAQAAIADLDGAELLR